jgi:hypothetical protein
MRFLPKVWIALLAAALLPCASFAASFTASLDRDTIALGETTTLTLRFDGQQPQSIPTLPKIPDLDFGNPAQNSIKMNINGTPSSILTLAYTITPQHEGEFTIPALNAEVDGQKLSSAPLKLVVNKPAPPVANANTDSQYTFARLSLPKTKVYAGETIVADLQLFFRQGTQPARQPQLAATLADGFTVGKVADTGQTITQVGNAVYNVIVAKIALTATRTGTLHAGPVNVNLSLLIPQPVRRDTLFGSVEMTSWEQKDFSVATETLPVQSLPLPDENRPANFSGVIGQFEIAASAGPNNVTVGDPVTVRLQISGHGNLDTVSLPDLNWEHFKTYPPTTKLETSDPFGLQGTKTFEQIISPLNTDVHEIPALNFSYFDPEEGKYHVLTQAAVPLTVKPAGATPLPQIAATKNSTPDNQTPQDILPVKNILGTVERNSVRPLVTQPVFFAVQSLPVLAFIGAFVWRKRTDNLANNPRLRRQRAVAQIVARGLGDLKKFAAANQPDDFFATLFHLLQEQLGERLDCPASAITENVVDEHPVLRAAPEAVRTALREQFQLCNQARYAPVRGTSELNSVAAQFEKLLGELQNLKS